jgi:hypothetical protein
MTVRGGLRELGEGIKRVYAGIERAYADVEAGHNLAGPSFLAHVFDAALLALFFAILSLPFVAVSLDVGVYGAPSGLGAQVSLSDLGRWTAAFGAVVAASLVAGTIGAPLVRANAILGALLTLVVAWGVAVVALPILPVLLHLNRDGNLGFVSPVWCFDVCGGPAMYANDILSGLDRLGDSWMAPLRAPVPFALLVGGVARWTHVVRRRARKPESTLS